MGQPFTVSLYWFKVPMRNSWIFSLFLRAHGLHINSKHPMFIRSSSNFFWMLGSIGIAGHTIQAATVCLQPLPSAIKYRNEIRIQCGQHLPHFFLSDTVTNSPLFHSTIRAQSFMEERERKWRWQWFKYSTFYLWFPAQDRSRNDFLDS